ncbi:SPI-1 type III secretion system chaperone SpaK [Pandoraea sputorum]|nr:SPI-1 type III secretion system chaperone SpaK [Pandoraea sputorum]
MFDADMGRVINAVPPSTITSTPTMPSYDLAQTLVEALKLIGCDPSKIDAVDNHSPIELTFNASPSIIVETLDNQVCSIHAVVATDEAARLHRANSERLLQFLIEPADWAVTGHVQLRERDNRLILHAQVKDDAAAEAEPFAQALTDFYDRIKLCREHLRA